MAIEIQYQLHQDTAPAIPLGKEIVEAIEEVLLPSNPTELTPIFLTKKFTGHAHYRWRVISLSRTQLGTPASPSATATPTIFNILLTEIGQIEKAAWLPNIFISNRPKTPKSFLHPGSFVEVEYGHPQEVGKSTGTIKTNKRYPESLQVGCMPKRRLAVVLDVKTSPGQNVIVQVVPISSQTPKAGDTSVIEVTNILTAHNFVHYTKASWAVGNMVESISPTQIFAPMVKFKYNTARDVGFRSRLTATQLQEVKMAVAHGTSQQTLIRELDAWKSRCEKLSEELEEIKTAKALATGEANLYKAFKQYMHEAVGDLTKEWEEFVAAIPKTE